MISPVAMARRRLEVTTTEDCDDCVEPPRSVATASATYLERVTQNISVWHNLAVEKTFFGNVREARGSTPAVEGRARVGGRGFILHGCGNSDR